MKILQLYDGDGKVAPEGSVSSVVYYLSRELAKKGYEVTVLERRVGNDLTVEFWNSIRFIRVERKKIASLPYKEMKKPIIGQLRLFLDRFLLAIEFYKFLKKEEFDIIHVHLPFAANILININKKIREKMIYTAHVGEERKRFCFDSKAPILFKLFSPDIYLMKRIKKSIVLNENIKSMLVAKGLKDEKLEVIPNGIDVNEFNISKDEIERVKRKYELDGITVMFAGTITPRKGVEVLVKAAEIVLRQCYKDVIFLFCGNLQIDKEFVKKIMNYIKNYELEDYVRFTGFISYEDLKALYSACDVFVLPSFEEGFGLVLTEAMASGKPLIGSNVGGIPMQIRDGWNGFLVKPGNEKQLAEKIMYLIENEKERKRMGRNSKKLAEEEFDWSKITDRYIKVYKNISR